MTAPDPPPRLSTVVTVQHATLLWLRDKIATGVFASGSRLRQEALAEQCGVSVPPVREALKTLEAEGLVVYTPRRGYFVASLSYPELSENYRIRDLLESEATRLAVPTLGRDELGRMRDAVKDMEAAHRSSDLTSLTAANRRFHFTLYEGSAMPRMLEFIRVLWNNTERHRSVYYATPANRRRVNAEHRAIMAALQRHDAEGAVDLLRTHRANALEALRALFESHPDEDAKVQGRL